MCFDVNTNFIAELQVENYSAVGTTIPEHQTFEMHIKLIKNLPRG
jgi:hypothetical protein